MSSATDSRAQAVRKLLAAEAEVAAGPPLSDWWRDLDVEAAYEIQDALLQRKVEQGERVVGIKLGLTSRAKQRQMGIDVPITGWLTDAMVLPLASPLPRDRLIHPRAEPEIVFLLGRRLEGPGVTAPVAAAAVERVFAGIEVLDSRYADFRFTLPDVVGDNASAALFTMGTRSVDPRALDLALEACLLEVGGSVVASATGAAVLGHPAEALAFAANELARRGIALEAGWLVLTGGMTDAVALQPGTSVSVSFTSLGDISLTAG